MASLFDNNQLPSLNELVARTDLPVGTPAAAPRGGLISSALSSGIDQLQAIGGAAIGAAGALTGIKPLQTFGENIATRNMAEAAANSRPDLENFPTDDLTKLPAWATYQTIKQVPNIAAVLLASRLPGIRSVGNLLPKQALAAGVAAPRLLGGAGVVGRTATFAEARQGAQFARNVASSAAASYPLAVGSLYQSAMDRGEPTAGDALKAAVLGVPYAALEAFQPRQLESFVTRGLKGNIGKRIATGFAAGSAVEAPVEAAQTAMEMSFRPDLSTKEKLTNIVNAAVTGGVVGGTFGGIGGLRRMKTVEPSTATNDDLKSTVDNILNPQEPNLMPEAAQQQIPGLPQPPAASQVFDTQTREVRPLVNVSDDELMQGLAAIEQRSLINNRRQSVLEALSGEDQARAEARKKAIAEAEANATNDFDRGLAAYDAGVAFDAANPPTAAPTNVDQVGSPEDMLLAQQIRQELDRRQSEQRQAQPSEFTGFDLFERAGTPLQESVNPLTAPTTVSPEADAQATKMQAAADTLVGGSKARWTNTIRAAETETDMIGAVITTLNAYDEAGKNVPNKLLEAAKSIGLVDSRGRPRNLADELNNAEKQNEALWQKARQTGEGVAQAQAYQKNKLQPLREQYARINEAKSRLAAAAQQAATTTPPVAEAPAPSTAAQAAEVFTAPGNQMQLSIKVDNPAERNDPQWLQRQQARAERVAGGKAVTGAMTAYTQEAVDMPVSMLRNIPSVSDTGSGPGTAKYERLLKRVAKRGWKPEPVTVVVNHRGEAYIANGNARIEVAATTGQQSIPVKVEWMNGAEQSQSRWSARNLSTIMASGVDQTQTGPRPAADIGQNSMRAAVVDQLVNRKLSQISQDESIPSELRSRAGEALAMTEGFAPNATQMADDVLAEYAVQTGEIAFSAQSVETQQPPMPDQAFDKAFARMTARLPAVAKNAIEVVPTVADLPSVIQRAAEKYGMTTDNVEGVVYGDKVYIVRSKVSSEAQLQELINHEIFGHGGARALFGDRRQQVFSTAFRLAGGLEGLRSIARTFGVERQLDLYVPGDRDLTTEEQVALVDELMAQVAGTSTGKFKMALLSWVSRFKTALINVLRTIGLNTVADRIGAFDAADVAYTVTQMRLAIEQGKAINGSDAAFKFGTIQGMTASAKNLMTTMGGVEKLMESRTYQEGTINFNRFHLYTSSAGHIADFFGDLFKNPDGTNALQKWVDANRLRGVTEQRLAHLTAKVLTAYDRLSPDVAEKLNKLMGATAFEIDPRKSWDEHTWLKGAKNESILRSHVAEYNKVYRTLVQTKSPALAVYQDMIYLNEAMHYAQQAVSLYNLIASDETVSSEMKNSVANPMDKFLADQVTYDSPQASRDFWAKETNALVAATKSYLQTQRSSNADPLALERIAESGNILKQRLTSIEAEQASMAQAPYFHIGRFGPYVLSFQIKKGEGNRTDEASVEAISKAFSDAGITGIEFQQNEKSPPRAFVRFENKTTWAEARAIADKLATQGHTLEVKSFSDQDEKAMNSFSLTEAPQWAQRLMDSVRSRFFGEELATTEETTKALKSVNSQFNRHLQQHFLNLLPETSINRVMTHRQYVLGYSSDMARSYFFRTQVGGRALANLYASEKMAEATKNIYGIVKDSRASSDVDATLKRQRVAAEIFKREAARPALLGNTWIDTARALNHAFFLGMSPSYVMVNLTQIGVLLWPELSKKHGFVNAAKAIAKVTPVAMKILSATMAEGKKNGWNNLPDASITKEVLTRAGVKGAQAEFVLKVVNSGLIDIGSQSREIGRVVEGTQTAKMENALRWASAAGYYSEMTSRLIAALSARELHGGNNDQMQRYVEDTVRQSMLSYETWNQARATGRMGLAGEFTPIMTSFMQYTFQLTEKLMREFHTAFVSGAKTKEEKAEARTFILTHMAAIVALSGTLGMPMASIFAAVFDKLADAFKDDEDEPTNVIAAYRNFLASILGKDVAEVVARGVPRAFGIDLSQRAGEQNLLPFAQPFARLIIDRRSWEEASKDWAFKSLGSPVGMAYSIINGTGKIASGDILAGMKEMVPAAIKGPVEAYKLSTEGYTDNKGNTLPMTAGASDVMWAALGFNPAVKAEYQEAKGVQASLEGSMRRKANQIRNDLISAITGNDIVGAQEAYQRAQVFDQANPAFAVLPRLAAAVKARRREAIRAKQTRTPLSTKPELASRTEFADLD